MHQQPHFQDHLTLNSLCFKKIFAKTTQFLEKSAFTTQYGLQIINPLLGSPKFSFNVPNQAEEWKSFYTRALDFLESQGIDPDVEGQRKKGWRQIKMMFEGEDCQALQTLIDNQTILPDAQQTPVLALKAIQSVIKEEVHFWHHRDQLLSDLHQLPEEGIHAISNRINTLVHKCKFPNEEVKEIIKIMVLQHAVKYHEARGWIHL